jgi:hypothetical protein
MGAGGKPTADHARATVAPALSAPAGALLYLLAGKEPGDCFDDDEHGLRATRHSIRLTVQEILEEEHVQKM